MQQSMIWLLMLKQMPNLSQPPKRRLMINFHFSCVKYIPYSLPVDKLFHLFMKLAENLWEKALVSETSIFILLAISQGIMFVP